MNFKNFVFMSGSKYILHNNETNKIPENIDKITSSQLISNLDLSQKVAKLPENIIGTINIQDGSITKEKLSSEIKIIVDETDNIDLNKITTEISEIKEIKIQDENDNQVGIIEGGGNKMYINIENEMGIYTGVTNILNINTMIDVNRDIEMNENNIMNVNTITSNINIKAPEYKIGENTILSTDTLGASITKSSLTTLGILEGLEMGGDIIMNDKNISNVNTIISENYKIGENIVLSTNTLGPTIVNSSLTSVGILTGLTMNGNIIMNNKNINGVNTISTINTNTTNVNASNVNALNVNATNITAINYKDNENNILLTGTTIGQNIVNSSLTSVGTLTGLNMGGNITMNNNDINSINVINATNVKAINYKDEENNILLTGTTLGTNIVNSSLTSLGILTELNMNGDINGVNTINTINVKAINYKDSEDNILLTSNTLGTNVVNSSLTTVGTLTGLNIDGDITMSNNNISQVNTINTINIKATSYRDEENNILLTSNTLGTNIVNSSLTSVGTLIGLDINGEITMNDKNISNVNTITSEKYKIGENIVLSTDTIGSTIVNSSLRTVGILTELEMSGDITMNNGNINGVNIINTINLTATEIEATNYKNNMNNTLLTTETLGPTVVNSSLTKVGILEELQINGDITMNNTNISDVNIISAINMKATNYRDSENNIILTKDTLGTNILNSSLTKVGTLTELGINGDITMNETNINKVKEIEINKVKHISNERKLKITMEDISESIQYDINYIVYGNNKYIIVEGNKIYESNDLNNWEEIGYFTNIVLQNPYISYENNIFIVSDIYIWKSTDGNNWIKVYDGGVPLTTIKYMNNRYIGVSRDGSKVIISLDEEDWTIYDTSGITIDDSERNTFMAYGNNKYVLINERMGNIYTSTNGINWTLETTNIEQYYNNDYTTLIYPIITTLIYEKEVFIASTSVGIYSSTDGITWEKRTNNVINQIINENDIIIGIGNEGVIIKSYDGINWETEMINNINYNFEITDKYYENKTIYENEENKIKSFVTNKNDQKKNILIIEILDTKIKFEDNINFNNSDVTEINNLSILNKLDIKKLNCETIEKIDETSEYIVSYKEDNIGQNDVGQLTKKSALIYGNNIYVYTNSYDEIAKIVSGYSTDGINYEREDNYHSVTYGKNKFIYVTQDGIYITHNIIHQYSLFNNKIKIDIPIEPVNTQPYITPLIRYANNIFVFMNNDGRISISNDGENWRIPTTYTVTNQCYSIAYGNNKYVIVGDNKITVSNDEDNWIEVTIPEAVEYKKIVYGNNIFITITDDKIFKSTDGETWEEVNTGIIVNRYNSIIYGDKFIIIGDLGKIIVSQDGVNWSEINSTVTNNLHVIGYGQDKYIILGAEIDDINDEKNHKLTLVLEKPKTKIVLNNEEIELTNNNVLNNLSLNMNNNNISNVDKLTCNTINIKSKEERKTVSIQISEKTLKKIQIIYEEPTIIKSSDIIARLDQPSSVGQIYTFGQSIPNKWIAVGSGTNTIAYSNNGINWIGLGSSIFTNRGYGVAWNGTMWIAAGSGTNSIAYSNDGTNWIGLGISIFTNNGFGIAWNGRMWIAVGEGTNSIAYSYNGINWTGLGTSIFTNAGYGVAWNGRMWIVVGSGTNSIAYSYDGISWSGLEESIFTNYGYGITWNGIMWIAVGAGTNTIAYSYDGINWTGLGTSIFTISGEGVAWNGEMWIVVGNGTNSIAYSYNGINWTGLGQSVFTNYGNGVIWNGTIWVAVGAGTNSIAYSNDGINWTGTNVFTNGGNGIAFNDFREHQIKIPASKMVAIGKGTNNIAYSYDGINWTGMGNNIFTDEVRGIAWNESMWVAVGAGTNTIAYSYDGIIWFGLGASVFFDGFDVAWNGIIWIAVGNGTNSIAYSYDGINWTGLGTSVFTTGLGVAWNGTMWMALGDGTNNMAYSYDGINWIGLGVSILEQIQDVAWNGIMWVAVGFALLEQTSIAYSYDGINWIEIDNNIIKFGGSKVVWNGELWVAVGSSQLLSIIDGIVEIVNGTNSIVYSYDGINWTGLGLSIFDDTGNGGVDVAWNGTMWVAVGSGTNSIAYSYDGINWTGLGDNIFNEGKGIIWNGTMWIAVGSGTNKIAYSYDGINWTGLTFIGLDNNIFTNGFGYKVVWNNGEGTAIIKNENKNKNNIK